jgi:hypothetical protein
MEIDAFLADTAETVEGKIYALGIGWNTIFTGGFPAVHPRVAIGVTIHVPYTETNEPHRLEVRLEDADGGRIPLSMPQPGQLGQSDEQVMVLGAEFNVGRPPQLPDGDEQVVCVALTINSLLIQRPEMYNWVLEIDGAELKRLPMRVQQL